MNENGNALPIDDRTADLATAAPRQAPFLAAGSMLPRLEADLTARYRTRQGGGWNGGLRCSFRVLDKDLRGMRAGAITMLSAGPHLGKSTLANQIAYQVAGWDGQHAAALYVSYEDDPEYLLLKQVARLSGWRINDLLDGVAAPDDANLQQAMRQLATTPLYYLRGGRETRPDDIIDRAAQVKQEAGAQNLLLVLDYLQYFARFAPGNSRVEQVGNAIAQVRRMTDATGAVVLVIGSQNREANKTGDSTMYGGMWSSDIEYDADTLLTLTKPKVDGKNADTFLREGKTIPLGPQHRLLKVEKARYGGTDSLMLLEFDNNFGAYKDPLDEHSQSGR